MVLEESRIVKKLLEAPGNRKSSLETSRNTCLANIILSFIRIVLLSVLTREFSKRYKRECRHPKSGQARQVY